MHVSVLAAHALHSAVSNQVPGVVPSVPGKQVASAVALVQVFTKPPPLHAAHTGGLALLRKFASLHVE